MIFRPQLLLSAMLLALAPAAAPAKDAPPATMIQVVEAQLLSIVHGVDGSERKIATDRIPYIVGRSCYMWSIRFTPSEGQGVIEEELILPAPANIWNSDAPTTVNEKGSAAKTLRTVFLNRGVASNGWCVAEGDPTGPYSFILRQNGQVIRRFDFIVGDII